MLDFSVVVSSGRRFLTVFILRKPADLMFPFLFFCTCTLVLQRNLHILMATASLEVNGCSET